MLESSLFESQGRQKTRKPVTVVVSALAHVVTFAVLVFIPLLHTQALTIPTAEMSLLLPQTEQPREIQVFSAQPRTVRPRPASQPGDFTAPQVIPQQVIRTVDAPELDRLRFVPSGGGRGFNDLVLAIGSNPLGTQPPDPEPPQPPPPPPVINAQPVRQGGKVQAANLIHRVNPEYPPIARQTRTQGVVVLEAVIDRDGNIDSLRVVSGNPLLTGAALDAVRQWKYRPTILNNEPVEVITTVTVTFTLQ